MQQRLVKKDSEIYFRFLNIKDKTQFMAEARRSGNVSVDPAILEKVLDEQVRDGADDEPHVVGVGGAGQVAAHLRAWKDKGLYWSRGVRDFLTILFTF